jgi:membrane protease YdiL (CAAX protease family)
MTAWHTFARAALVSQGGDDANPMLVPNIEPGPNLAVALLGAVLAAGSLAISLRVWNVVRRMLPKAPRHPARWGFVHAVSIVVIALFVLVLEREIWPPISKVGSSAGSSIGSSAGADDPAATDVVTELFLTCAVTGSVALWILFVARRVDPHGWWALGLRAGGNARSVVAAALMFAFVLPGIWGVGLVWAWVLEHVGAGFQPQRIAADVSKLSAADAGKVLVMGVLVAPLFEEIVFRGFLQGLFVERLGQRAGILLTCLMFGALHGQSAFLPIFCLSLLLCAVMNHTQRLAASFTVHALNNAIVFAVYLVAGDTRLVTGVAALPFHG